jgi:sugar phosphate isomerase/epimerase
MAVLPTTGRGLVRLLADSGALLVQANDDVLQTRDARRAWAEFADNARDWGDSAGEIGELGRLDAADQLDEQLQELARLGVTVRVGTRNLVSGSGERALHFTALYVVGMPKGREVAEVAVPRRVQMGF